MGEGNVGAGTGGAAAIIEAQKDMSPGSDLTVIFYIGSEGGKEEVFSKQAREKIYSSIIEGLKRGTIREYKRIFCFDHDVLANDHELNSGFSDVS